MKLRVPVTFFLTFGAALCLLVALNLKPATVFARAGSVPVTIAADRPAEEHEAAEGSARSEPPKPPDRHAQAWDLFLRLDSDIQAKIDPRLLDEFQGDVLPTHLQNQAPDAVATLGIEKTRFLVYLRTQPSLAPLADQVFASAVDQRQAIHNLLVDQAAAAQEPLRAVLDTHLETGNVAAYQPFYIVNALAVEGDLMTIVELARRDDVAHIDANYPLEALWAAQQRPTMGPVPAPIHPASVDAQVTPNWNIELVEADRVWSQLRVEGRGAVVAGFDTGVFYTHPAVARQYRGRTADGVYDHNYNWFEPDGNLYADGNFGTSLTQEPYDCDYYGTHGTHTMGTMVGDGGSPGTRIGMAPEANWIALPGICYGTMPGGRGDDIGGIKAFQWLLCPTDLSGDLATADCSKAPDVINNSWGSANPTGQVFRPILQMLRAAGIAPVFAAGNPSAGAGSIGSPGNAPEAITVGATNFEDQVAGFSGRGPSFYAGEQKPELSAPGVNVLSSVGSFGQGYYSYSGTSMAAPHVAGLIALMVSADLRDGVRDFSVDELETFMIHTAVDLGESGADDDYGYGRIDAFEAVRWALSAGDLAGNVIDSISRQPVDHPAVTGLSSSGTRFAATGSASGAYSVTVPGGVYTIDVNAWGYAPATFADQQVVVGAASLVDFTLDALPRQTVSGQIEGQGPVAGATVLVAGNPAIRTTSAADGSFVLNLPQGEHLLTVEAVGFRRTDYAVDVTGGPVAASITLDATPRILLVDADARYGWFFGWPVHAIFDWALDEHGYSRDFWPIQSTQFSDTAVLDDGSTGYGLPSLATLEQYDIVIWNQGACYFGLGGCMTALGDDMLQRLAAYLDGGGRMLLSGQDIAYFDDGTEFFDTYVRSDLLYDFAAVEGDTLTGSGALAGIQLELTNASLYGHSNGVFYLSPDSVTAQGEIDYVGPGTPPSDGDAAGPGVSYPLMSYDRSGGAAVMASVPCEADYRLLFYPVAYENIGPRADQRGPEIAETLHRSIEWLTAERPDVSVIPMLDRFEQSTEPGTSVSYRLDLVNEGSTAAVVKLSLTDDRWSGTVISGTAPLDGPIVVPPCTQQGVRIRVTVPPTADNGIAGETLITIDVESDEQTELTLTTTALTGWQGETSAPNQIWSHGLAASRDGLQIYALGGYKARIADGYYDYTASDEILRYDVCRRSWHSAGELAFPRVSFGAARIGDKLYLIGGFEVDPVWGYSTLTASVQTVDLVTGAIEEQAPLPLPLAGAAVAVYGDDIYLFGGGNAYQGSNIVLRYSSNANQWQELPPLPGSSRLNAAAATLDGRIYVVGDYNGSVGLLAFDPQTGLWEERAELPTARNDASLVPSPDGYLYLLGGYSYSGYIGGRVDRYSPAADRWEAVSSLSTNQRSGARGVYAGGRLYAIGGRGAFQTTEALATGRSFCLSDKVGPNSVLAESRAAYTIQLQPDVASVPGVVVVDQLPPEVGFVEFTEPTTAEYDASQHTIRWQGKIPAGADGIRIPYLVDLSEGSNRTAEIGDLITNTLSVSAVGFLSPGETLQFSRVVTSSVIFADFVASTKQVEPLRAASGDPVTYTIELRSITPAGDLLMMEDPLPAELAIVPGSLTASTGAAVYDEERHMVRWEGVVAAATDAYINLSDNYTWGDVSGAGEVPDVEFGWRDISSTGTSLGGGDDVLRCDVPLGFDFPFYGEQFSEFCVSTNGFISFDPTAYSTLYNLCPIELFTSFNWMIAAVWDDIVIDGAMYYESFGKAPERYLIVQWQDARPWQIYNRSYANFQLVLHESGRIDLNVLTAGGEDGMRSTTGLLGAAPGEHVTYACNQPRTLQNNQTVRFIPPGTSTGGVGATVQFSAVAAPSVAVNRPITNTAVIRTSGDQTYTRTAIALFNPVSLAESTLTVDRSDVAPGEQARYTVTLRNNGLIPARGAMLNGELPDEVTEVGIECSAGFCEFVNGAVVWQGDVAPDEPVEIRISVVLNTLVADGVNIPLELDLDDGTGVQKRLRGGFTVIRANLATSSVRLRPAFVEPGRSADLLLLIHNSGRLTTNSRATVELPDGLDYSETPICGRGACALSGNTLTWEGESAPRTVVQVRLPLTVPADAAFGTLYDFTGTIEDLRWREQFALDGIVMVAHNAYLPRIFTPDLPDNYIYLPVIR